MCLLFLVWVLEWMSFPCSSFPCSPLTPPSSPSSPPCSSFAFSPLSSPPYSSLAYSPHSLPTSSVSASVSARPLSSSPDPSSSVRPSLSSSSSPSSQLSGSGSRPEHHRRTHHLRRGVATIQLSFPISIEVLLVQFWYVRVCGMESQHVLLHGLHVWVWSCARRSDVVRRHTCQVSGGDTIRCMSGANSGAWTRMFRNSARSAGELRDVRSLVRLCQ